MTRDGWNDRLRVIAALAVTPHEGAALEAACDGAAAALYPASGAATRALVANVLRQQVEQAREYERMRDASGKS